MPLSTCCERGGTQRKVAEGDAHAPSQPVKSCSQREVAGRRCGQPKSLANDGELCNKPVGWPFPTAVDEPTQEGPKRP